MPPRSDLDKPVNIGHIREFKNFLDSDHGIAKQKRLDGELLDRYYAENKFALDDTDNEKRTRRVVPERFDSGEAARIINLVLSFYATPPLAQMRRLLNEKSASAAEIAGIAVNEAIDQLNATPNSPWLTNVFDKTLLGRSVDIVLHGNAWYSDFPWKHDDETEEDWKSRHALWRRRSPIPVTWQTINAEEAFPQSLGTVKDEVLAVKTVTWSDMTQMFSANELRDVPVPDPDSARYFAEVTLGIYSNREQLSYVWLAQHKSGILRTNDGWGIGGEFKDKIIRSIEHGMGQSAIRITPGMTGGKMEWGKWWASILFPIRGLLDQVDRLGSRASTAAKFDAYPLMQEHKNLSGIGDDGLGARAENEETFEGDVLQYDAGDTIAGRGREGMSPVFQPQHGNVTRELFIMALDRCGQITGASEALEGKLQANTPAWSTNFSSEVAKQKLRPLTAAIIAGFLDISEGIIKSVEVFGERIPLSSPEEGKGTVWLEPKDLSDLAPALAGSYTPSTISNFRADLETMMDMIERSKETGFPSPIWLADKLGGISDYWRQYQENFEISAITDPEIRKMQLQVLRDRFEVAAATEEGMTQEQFEAIAHLLPPDVAAQLRQRFQAGPEVLQQNGNAGQGTSSETAGLLRAGKPFSTTGTGPQPTGQGSISGQ